MAHTCGIKTSWVTYICNKWINDVWLMLYYFWFVNKDFTCLSGILLTGTLGTDFRGIVSEIHTFFQENKFQMPSREWRQKMSRSQCIKHEAFIKSEIRRAIFPPTYMTSSSQIIINADTEELLLIKFNDFTVWLWTSELTLKCEILIQVMLGVLSIWPIIEIHQFSFLKYLCYGRKVIARD